jgi:hypothetical protein
MHVFCLYERLSERCPMYMLILNVKNIVIKIKKKNIVLHSARRDFARFPCLE